VRWIGQEDLAGVPTRDGALGSDFQKGNERVPFCGCARSGLDILSGHVRLFAVRRHVE
jgi:hypothetical protein